jgi:hypothetical protein
MDSPLSIRIRTASSLCALLFLYACLSPGARAQDQLLFPSPSAPPPMKFISNTERGQLSAAHDAKARLKASIDIAESRILRAEQFTVDQRFIAAITELGIYQAIIEDALTFLGQQKTDSNKTRDLYKRLEIQLRADATRLESIRRVTPSEFAIHIRTIRDFADGARTIALNAFFSDTVLPEGSDKKANPADRNSSAAAPATQSKKQQ